MQQLTALSSLLWGLLAPSALTLSPVPSPGSLLSHLPSLSPETGALQREQQIDHSHPPIKKKKQLITGATIRIRSGLNAPIDNHSWDCISKRKPAKSGLVDSQRPRKTHRLSLQLLSIAQKEHGRAGLWVILSKQCAVERYL